MAQPGWLSKTTSESQRSLEPGSITLSCLGAGAQAAAEDLAAAPLSAADRGGGEQGDVPGALFNFLSNQNKGPVTSCAASDHLI